MDAGIPGYQKTSGVSGSLSSVGSDTLNNLMTLWAEGFKKEYPNVRIQIEGKGSSTAPPALIQGTAQLGPMSRTMKAEEIDDFEKKYGYKPTPIRVAVDGIGVFVNKDNPVKCLTMQQIDGIFSKGRACGGKADRHLGPGRPRRRRLGQAADQPLRPQLRLRHLRLLQGARALQGRLQGHRQGAAGLGLGGAGRDRGQVRHRLQRHRLQDLGRAGRPGGRQGRASASTTARRTCSPASTRWPASSTSTSTRRPTSRFDPLVREFLKYVLSQQGQQIVVKDGFIPLTAKIVQEELAKLQ